MIAVDEDKLNYSPEGDGTDSDREENISGGIDRNVQEADSQDNSGSPKREDDYGGLEEYDPRYLPEKSIYEQSGEMVRSELSNEEMEALLEGFGDEYAQGEIMSEADIAVDSVNLDELDFNFDADSTANVADAENEIDDAELEFIQDVTVYDTVERDDPFSEAIALATEGFSGDFGEYMSDGVVGPDEKDGYAPSKGLKFNFDKEKLKWWLKIPFLKSIPVGMLTLAAVLIFVIISVGVAGLFIIKTLNGMSPAKHELIDNAQVISQPRYVLNNSSSIYLTTTPVLYMMDIIEIVKLIANEEITEVAFRYDVGWDKYKVSLTDNKYQEYNLLPESRVKGNYGNVLKFEPLESGISGIVFTVEEISTGIVSNFAFKFEGGLKVMPVSYLNVQDIATAEEDISIKLMNGYFSNNTSDVTFTFQWESDAQIDFDEIYLSTGSKRMQAVTENIRCYSGGDNRDIYNVKFGAMSSLDGEASLTFSNVYYDYPLNLEIDTTSLLKNTPENQKIIMLGDNTLTLERMGAMGPIHVLVSNCANIEGERVRAEYETVLTLTDNGGKEYKIVGNCRSSEIGADIIFDTRTLENYEELGQLHVTGFELSRVKVYREDIKASFNMDKTTSYRNANDRKALEAANEFLTSEGILSYNLVFYYWEGSNFIAEYQVFEDDKIKTYLVSSVVERNEYAFKKSLISE